MTVYRSIDYVSTQTSVLGRIEDIEMYDNEDEHLDKHVFMVKMVPNDGTSMQQMNDVLMKVELDEKHSVIGGSARIIVSNPNRYNDTSRGVGGSGTKLA
jgi:hypothetical protein